MNRNLLAAYEEKTNPKINSVVAEGLAYTQTQEVVYYINQVIEFIFKALNANENIGDRFRYCGCRKISAAEEYKLILEKNQRSYDIAKNTLFIVEYVFEFTDIQNVGGRIEKRTERISKYLQLPYVGRSGQIVLSNSKFNIYPVLSDKVISIIQDGIFVAVLSSKFHIYKLHHYIKIDGVPEQRSVIHSEIYNAKAKPSSGKDGTGNVNTTLFHYLMCDKNGFDEAMKEYLGINAKAILVADAANYPKEDWIHYKSLGIAPTSFRGYTPPKIMVVAPRSEVESVQDSEMKEAIKDFIASFIYLLDYLSDYFGNNLASVNSSVKMRAAMGKILSESSSMTGNNINKINEHMYSLKTTYLDPITQKSLKDNGFPHDDIFKLLCYLNIKFNSFMRDAPSIVGSMYNKTLNTNLYVFNPITTDIIYILYDLVANAKRGLKKQDVLNTLKKHFKMGGIFKINSGNSMVTSVTYSGDNMATKVTCALPTQSTYNNNNKSAKKSKSKSATVFDYETILHESIAEVGVYSAMTKTKPEGRNRLNRFVMFNEDFEIVRNPKFKDLLDRVGNMIKRK